PKNRTEDRRGTRRSKGISTKLKNMVRMRRGVTNDCMALPVILPAHKSIPNFLRLRHVTIFGIRLAEQIIENKTLVGRTLPYKHSYRFQTADSLRRQVVAEQQSRHLKNNLQTLVLVLQLKTKIQPTVNLLHHLFHIL